MSSGKWPAHTSYAVTSLTATQASAAGLAAIICGHWAAEDRLHWVRDMDSGEDRSQVRTANSPRILAALRNLATTILRLAGHASIAAAIPAPRPPPGPAAAGEHELSGDVAGHCSKPARWKNEGSWPAARTEAGMTPSYVKVTDLRVGLPVEHLGKPDPTPVLDGTLRANGLVLYPGHPGRVWSTLTQHVQVTWAGLEDEPATYALGFSLPGDDETCYPSLGLLTEDEFTRRERALQDRLATRTNLSGWVPPWSRGDSPS